MPSGVERIAAERDRQINELGYHSMHDAEHDDHDLAFAAACYAAPVPVFLVRTDEHDDPSNKRHGRTEWVMPWPNEWGEFTRSDRIDELTKAGALIAAEIDRILAQEAAESAPE